MHVQVFVLCRKDVGLLPMLERCRRRRRSFHVGKEKAAFPCWKGVGLLSSLDKSRPTFYAGKLQFSNHGLFSFNGKKMLIFLSQRYYSPQPSFYIGQKKVCLLIWNFFIVNFSCIIINIQVPMQFIHIGFYQKN